MEFVLIVTHQLSIILIIICEDEDRNSEEKTWVYIPGEWKVLCTFT
jgi:hypothetical protein